MVIFFLYKISFCALKKNCVEREQHSYKILSIEARSALYSVVALKKAFDWARMVRMVRMQLAVAESDMIAIAPNSRADSRLGNILFFKGHF